MGINIGLIKIYIEDDILNEETFSDLEIEKIKSVFNLENITFLEPNLEHSTIEDFLDYLEFSDVDKCYIVTNTSSLRFSNIIKFIKRELEIDISIQISNDIEDEKLKDINFDFSKPACITLQQRLNNSYILYNSGFYTYSEKVHLKHIFIENLNDIKSLDNSLLRNFSMNSLIITNNLNSEIFSENISFSKIIHYEDFFQKSNTNLLFENLSPNEIKDRLEKYINNGEIEGPPYLIRNLGKYLKNKKIHSLFIKKGKIYYDSEFNMLLSDNLSNNIFEILNNIAMLPVFSDFPDSLIVDYYLGSMLKQSNEKIERNISKFTNFNIQYNLNDNYNEYNNWLGYNIEEKFYLYNKIYNRTFEVNEKLIEIYEYLAKSDEEKLNSVDDKLLKEVKDLLENVKC